MEPTRNEDRRDRRSAFLYGMIAAAVLLVIAVAGPPLLSSLYPGDGTGSPGNPEHTQPVAPRTK